MTIYYWSMKTWLRMIDPLLDSMIRLTENSTNI